MVDAAKALENILGIPVWVDRGFVWDTEETENFLRFERNSHKRVVKKNRVGAIDDYDKDGNWIGKSLHYLPSFYARTYEEKESLQNSKQWIPAGYPVDVWVKVFSNMEKKQLSKKQIGQLIDTLSPWFIRT